MLLDTDVMVDYWLSRVRTSNARLTAKSPARGPLAKVTATSSGPLAPFGTRTECVQKLPHMNPDCSRARATPPLSARRMSAWPEMKSSLSLRDC